MKIDRFMRDKLGSKYRMLESRLTVSYDRRQKALFVDQFSGNDLWHN